MATPVRPRVVMHADMDAFYAAVEIRDRPELESKPVVVGPDPREFSRGVVLTSAPSSERTSLKTFFRAWPHVAQDVTI